MAKILWLPPSEISHMERWKYGNKCPDNTALSGLCRAKPYNYYIEKIHNTLYVSDIVRCISGKRALRIALIVNNTVGAEWIEMAGDGPLDVE